MKKMTMAGALLCLELAKPAVAAPAKTCDQLVTNSTVAAQRADWIVDADVSNIFKPYATGPRLNFVLENVNALHGTVTKRRIFTMSVLVDHCFRDGAKAVLGKRAEQMVGKRFRFYGIKLEKSFGERFFYVEPAGRPLPKLEQELVQDRVEPAESKPTAHAPWVRAYSPRGEFSIEMPGVVESITYTQAQQPWWMLRTLDEAGTAYLAVFQRSGPDSALGITFDRESSKDGVQTTTFRGAEAIYTSGEDPASKEARLMHGLWFRVPGGVYMLGVSYKKGHEVPDSVRQRFFESFQFK
jgi:hypothetical protein